MQRTILMSRSSSLSLLHLAAVVSCLASSCLGAPPPEKPHIKDAKFLDPKATENEILHVAREGSAQLDPKTYDNKGLEVTVDCQKLTAVKLKVFWFGTEVGKEKKEHVWLPTFTREIPLTPDAKGLATVHTNVVHFAKDIAKVKEYDTTAYVFEGWALCVVDSAEHMLSAVKTSSSAIDKSLKDLPKGQPEGN